MPIQKFSTILADPPWQFKVRTARGRAKSPDMHYPCMNLDDIAAMPVAQVAAPDAILFLWTTWPMMADGSAHEVVKGWGFQAVTGGSWVKMRRAAAPRIGTGYYQRSVSEPFLYCVDKNTDPDTAMDLITADYEEIADTPQGDGLITAPYLIAKHGKGDCPKMGTQFLDVMFHPPGRHSAKPEETYDRVELYKGPYLEIFARPNDGGLFPDRPHWTKIGNEITGRDVREDLDRLIKGEAL